MNKIVNRFLLARDNLIPEMLLIQPEFTNSACRLFTIAKNPKYDKYRCALVSLIYFIF